MTNTQLLHNLIAIAQSAGNAIRSEKFDEAEDDLNDVLWCAEQLAHPQLLCGARYALESMRQGHPDSSDRALKNLITNADRFLGRV